MEASKNGEHYSAANGSGNGSPWHKRKGIHACGSVRDMAEAGNRILLDRERWAIDPAATSSTMQLGRRR
eukprot:6853381-Pyramimonas_sp.AAC.1